jgi:hypothetical protein
MPGDNSEKVASPKSNIPDDDDLRYIDINGYTNSLNDSDISLHYSPYHPADNRINDTTDDMVEAIQQHNAARTVMKNIESSLKFGSLATFSAFGFTFGTLVSLQTSSNLINDLNYLSKKYIGPKMAETFLDNVVMKKIKALAILIRQKKALNDLIKFFKTNEAVAVARKIAEDIKFLLSPQISVSLFMGLMVATLIISYAISKKPPLKKSSNLLHDETKKQTIVKANKIIKNITVALGISSAGLGLGAATYGILQLQPIKNATTILTDKMINGSFLTSLTNKELSANLSQLTKTAIENKTVDKLATLALKPGKLKNIVLKSVENSLNSNATKLLIALIVSSVTMAALLACTKILDKNNTKMP